MGKTVQGFEIDDDGRMHMYGGKVTRQQRRSEQRLIGWSPGPRTRWQKIKRAAVG